LNELLENVGASINAPFIPPMTECLSLLWLELTAKCNLQCVHCYADSSPARPLHETMTFADWQSALKQSRRLGCKDVQFIGGEPTLYPGLQDLIASAQENGYTGIEVYTNGLHFSRSIRDALVRYKVTLAFSVYADTAPIHDAVTARDGSFVRTVESIRWAIAQGLRVRVGIVAMQTNADVIERTRRTFAELGAWHVGIDRVRGVGRGAQIKRDTQGYSELCGSCWNGKLCITASGEIFPCVFARFCPVGKFRDGLEFVARSTALADFRQRMRAKNSSRSNGEIQASTTTCKPDVPDVPCDPDLPDVPCDPDLPDVPCDPALPDVPELPDDPPEPSGPCSPQPMPPDCTPERPPRCDPAVTA
jgi:MoaA/NifB/PqqE/SkfB family radical SAM enzyme